MSNNEFLTLKDSATLIGVNERTLKKILDKNKNKFNCAKIGGRYLISKDKLLSILNNESLNY